jgi:hypothetical protein
MSCIKNLGESAIAPAVDDIVDADSARALRALPEGPPDSERNGRGKKHQHTRRGFRNLRERYLAREHARIAAANHPSRSLEVES